MWRGKSSDRNSSDNMLPILLPEHGSDSGNEGCETSE